MPTYVCSLIKPDSAEYTVVKCIYRSSIKLTGCWI